MSARFAETAHRRAKGAPPVEDVTKQIESIADRVVEMRRAVRALSREMGAMLHALDALRLDVAAMKPQTTKTKEKKR